MDGREAMSSYFLHRAIGTPPGFHAAGMFRQMPNPGSTPQPNSSGGGSFGSAFAAEPRSSANLGDSTTEPVKRKRGRPRKYGPDGTVSLALSPTSSTPVESAAGSAPSSQKRGRGRPPGTGRKQQLASLGEWMSGSAGDGYTPHVIIIPIGEDVSTKIMSFSQQGPRAVCILSANGAVSTVTLRQPSSSGGIVTYEGRFEILCLSGSYLLVDEGGTRSRSGGLSISLSSSDGRIIGGGVGGPLIAASPVQVIVGSFVYRGGLKSKNKAKAIEESEPLLLGYKQSTPSSTSDQHLSPSFLMGGWPSRETDIRNPSLDIDLTQG